MTSNQCSGSAPSNISLRGLQAFHGVPVMPFTPNAQSSSKNATACAENAGAPGLSSCTPSVGTEAPEFTARAVMEGRIKDIELSQYTQNEQWLILMFIPMAWSFICPTEIRAFDRRLQEFEARKCGVVFCSTDSEFVLRAWNQTPEEDGGLGRVSVPLMSDRSRRIAREYGVLIESEGVTQRSMFIIDPRGMVRQVTTNDANVGRSVDEARRLVDALQFTDEFGEGCPIDWKKGDRGLSMDNDKESNRDKTEDRAKSTSPQSAKAPLRPKNVRMNTWGGNGAWLAGQQSDASTPTQMPLSTPSQRHYHEMRHTNPMETNRRGESLPIAGNWNMNTPTATSRLLPAQGGKQKRVQSPSREMGSMGGYFDQIVSPLEQPQTVLNAMMNSAH